MWNMHHVAPFFLWYILTVLCPLSVYASESEVFSSGEEMNDTVEDKAVAEAINIEETLDTIDDIVFFEDPEPVTDVYLMPGSGFDDFQYKAGRYKLLTSDGVWDSDIFEIECVWNRDDFQNAMDAGTREFTVYGKYVQPEPDSGFWDEETHRLWDAGQIQIKGGMDLCVNVHIRPDDYVTVYRPDLDMQIQTIWVDRDNPTDFCDLYLMSYDSLIQEESLYDTPGLEFEIIWDEASYIAGLESKADQFEIAGYYGELWGGEPWQHELRAKGLIQTQGSTKTIIRVRKPEKQVYVNPYDNRVGYVWPCEFQIYIRPETPYEATVLPVSSGLEPENGDLEQIRDFGLEWSRSDYEAGIASGKESFIVSGQYGPDPEWPPEDQKRYANGSIQIAKSTPSPKLTVHILNEELPFTVVMQLRDGLIPIFKFPWPNGAEKVSWAFSFDKETWYSEEIWWSSEYDNNLAVGIAAVYDDNDRMISIPEDDPSPFYCKLTVTGSLFEGETRVMIVSPDASGNWDMEEDQGGDHGGGGQGEHDRPGKDNPGQTIKNPQPSENLPEVPPNDGALPIKDHPALIVQQPPASPAGNRVQTSSISSDIVKTQEETPWVTRQSIGSSSDTREADASHDDGNMDVGAAPPSAAEAKAAPQPLSGQILKYITAAAATLLLIIFGTVFTWLYQKKKK